MTKREVADFDAFKQRMSDKYNAIHTRNMYGNWLNKALKTAATKGRRDVTNRSDTTSPEKRR